MNQREIEGMETYLREQLEFNAISKGVTWHKTFEEANLERFIRTAAGLGIPTRSLLDIGCREGRVLALAERLLNDARLAGVDITPEFIGLAEDHGHEVYLADMHSLPFQDGEFDLTYCFHTLEHAYDLQKALGELGRVTGSALFIGVPIQGQQVFDDNKSHYVRCGSAIDWIKQFESLLPKWDLYEMYYNRTDTVLTEYINLTFVRFKEGLREAIA